MLQNVAIAQITILNGIKRKNRIKTKYLYSCSFHFHHFHNIQSVASWNYVRNSLKYQHEYTGIFLEKTNVRDLRHTYPSSFDNLKVIIRKIPIN